VPRGERSKVSVHVSRSGEVTLAGRPLFVGDADALIARIDQLLPADEVYSIVTPNVDQTIGIEHDAALHVAYDEAEIRIADGTPLVLLARMLGAHGLQRLTGADLLPIAAQLSGRRGWRIAVTGGATSVSEKAAAELREQYGADVVSIPFPKIAEVGDVESAQVIAELHEAKADIIFVCLGSPKQDVWVSHWREKLPPGVYVGAGAAVDFVAGTKRRAPLIVQKMGMEWFFRMAQEPRRLAGRYLVRGPHFLSVVARSFAERNSRP
jgi:N-acetylglucosaminyldiphosphoundecaprenol N-acetyl-beta-D-mannosaminyltransferase